MAAIRSFLLLGLSTLACARGSTNASPVRTFSVPAQAPDTTPGWLLHENNTYGNYARGVVAVTFHEGTSLADRQAAIDKVRGEVIGGWRMILVKEGKYAVKVDDGGDPRKLDELIDQLSALPQVRLATRVELVAASSEAPVSSDSSE
jgi:hypothetical protein